MSDVYRIAAVALATVLAVGVLAWRRHRGVSGRAAAVVLVFSSVASSAWLAWHGETFGLVLLTAWAVMAAVEYAGEEIDAQLDESWSCPRCGTIDDHAHSPMRFYRRENS